MTAEFSKLLHTPYWWDDGAHPRVSLAEMSKKFGAETAQAAFNEATPAFEHLQFLLNQYSIDCDYQPTGRIQLAWNKSQFAAQKRLARNMNANTDFHIDVLERAQVDAGGFGGGRSYDSGVPDPSYKPQRIYC